MKIAVQLSGEPRFTAGFQSFLDNLTGYSHADWFLYLVNNSNPDKRGVFIPESWKKFELEWAIEKIKNNLPANSYLQSLTISDCHEKSWPTAKNLHCLIGDNPVPKLYNMHYNMFKANQLRINYQECNDIKYDFVIRVRPDCSLDKMIDVNDFKINENEIIMPDNNWFGFELVNDQFAIGKPSDMDTYSNLVSFIKEYNDNGVTFHPETIFAHHLRVNQIKTIRGGFECNIHRNPQLDKWC
jgi:hypothetical protein